VRYRLTERFDFCTFIQVKKTVFIFLILFSATANLFSQAAGNERAITLRGTVFDLNDSTARPAPVVVNKRVGTGIMTVGGAAFSITGLNTDTFLISSGGYEAVRVCFRDSTAKEVYVVRVGLKMRENTLNLVTIYPVKDLDQIKKEREGLGQKSTTTTQGATDAVSSPITFLYERFSQEGRSKAAVAAMENQDRVREVVKDLFRTYVRSGVIDLKEEDFDAFIAYLNISEEYLRTANDYDLAVYIRHRYLTYKAAQQMHNRNQH
jgi:hypothetical protein